MAEDDSTVGKLLGNISSGATTGKPKYTTYPASESHDKALSRLKVNMKKIKAAGKAYREQ